MKRILILCCCFTAVFQARAQLTLDECRRLAREIELAKIICELKHTINR